MMSDAVSEENKHSKTARRKSGIGKAATSGFLWLAFQSFASRGIGFVSQLLLAKLLVPEDFGLIGLAFTVTMIANTIIGFGVDDVLLQRQKSIGQWETPAFWLSLVIGFVGMIGMMAIAPIAAHWYHSPELTGLIIALAVGTLFRSVVTVPSVKIRVQMDFRFLATYNTYDLFALQALTIAFAAIGMGAYAFALPFPIVGAARAFFFWRRAPSLTSRKFRSVQMKYLIGNSSVILFMRTIGEIINQGDYIVIGLIASKIEVGYYYFAFRISAQSVRMLGSNVSNVVFPALAQYRDNPSKQIDAAVRASRLLAYLVIPFCGLQAAVAEPGLHLLFGDRWMRAVPYVVVLSIGLPFEAISWITGALLSARREFTRQLRFQITAAFLFFAMVIIGSLSNGVMGVAVSVAIYYFVWSPVTSFMVLVGHDTTRKTIAELYAAPTIFSALAVGASLFLTNLSFGRNADFMRCAEIGIMTCCFYTALLYMFKKDIINEIKGRFLKKK